MIVSYLLQFCKQVLILKPQLFIFYFICDYRFLLFVRKWTTCMSTNKPGAEFSVGTFISRTGSLLVGDLPMVASPALAAKLGLHEALILQQVHYWLTDQQGLKTLDGASWIQKTYNEILNHFPFFSLRTLKRLTYKLEKLEILKSTSNFNQNSSDLSKWYTLNYEKLESLFVIKKHRPTVQKRQSVSSISNKKSEAGGRATLARGGRATLAPLPYRDLIYNNNNSYLSNTKDKINAEENEAIVVFQNEKLDSLGISRRQWKKWIETHGHGYIASKLSLLERSKPLDQAKFLNAAIKFDWLYADLKNKPPKTSPQEAKMEKVYPARDENVAWFESLSMDEKKALNAEAVRIWYIFDLHLKSANIRVWDDGFSAHWLFDSLMQTLRRAK